MDKSELSSCLLNVACHRGLGWVGVKCVERGCSIHPRIANCPDACGSLNDKVFYHASERSGEESELGRTGGCGGRGGRLVHRLNIRLRSLSNAFVRVLVGVRPKTHLQLYGNLVLSVAHCNALDTE